MYRLIDYGAMLRDRRRIDAYSRALASVITPDSVVLDIGTGIGTFTLLACRFGAARVYAIERSDVIAVAEEHVRANGFADRVHFLQGDAASIELPERVDVIVSDLAGALPLFEEHLPTVVALRDRFLKPNGVLIPQRDRLFGAPVSNAELYARIVDPWRSIDGLDLSAGATMALNTPQAHAITPHDLAAEPQCWATLDYATIDSPHVHGSATWTIDAQREIHGIALWFESTLRDNITYSSGPSSHDSVHATMLLPLQEPVRATTLRVELEAVLASGRYVTTWTVNGQQQSSFLSEPRSTRVSDQVLARKVGSELLLLDQNSGVYHVLNETGARVWELLQRGDAIEDIARAIASDYEIDKQSAAADVAAVVDELRKANLVRR